MYNSELMTDLRRVCTSPASKEDNMQLYERLPDSRDEMITRNMPLAIMLTDRYTQQHPQYQYLYDDLLSSAFSGLVHAVAALSTSHRPERIRPTGYITLYVTHSLKDVALMAPMIVPSLRTQKRKPYLPPITTESDVLPDQIAQRNDNDFIDLCETITHCCQSHIEQQVVDLRAQRYTLREVATILGTSEATVRRTIRTVHKRVKPRLS
jgi:RNA polymerase sigma factor (sigma-70 family)